MHSAQPKRHKVGGVICRKEGCGGQFRVGNLGGFGGVILIPFRLNSVKWLSGPENLLRAGGGYSHGRNLGGEMGRF